MSAAGPYSLKPFSNDPSASPSSLRFEFSVSRHTNGLDVAFTLAGKNASDLQKLVIPDLLDSEHRLRRDELWKHTCLEVFFASAHEQRYFEMNLSPSGDWNLYSFSGYRVGQMPVIDIEPPLQRVEAVKLSSSSYTWHARLGLPNEWVGGSLVIGATSVLEYKSGVREYWALAHRGTKPDFHLRESFTLLI